MPALSLILTGCVTHEVVVDLAHLGYVRMLILTYGQNFTVELESGAHPCPILSSNVTATLRGNATDIPMTITGGGEDRSTETGECFPIIMKAAGRPARVENAELVIADDSMNALIDLGGALSAPTVTLVPAGPWELGANRTYRVAHSQRVLVRTARSATIQIEPGVGEPIQRLAAVEGDELVFTTLALPSSGTGKVTISVTGPQEATLDCLPLMTNCTITVPRTPIEVDVTFVP